MEEHPGATTFVRNRSTRSSHGPLRPARFGKGFGPKASGPKPFGLVKGLGFTFAISLIARPAMASGSLELIPDPIILCVMIVGFVLLIFPLNELIFKPIFRSLDERAERIKGARERSEQLQREADAVLERYETALLETRAESEEARQAQLAAAREEQANLTAQAKTEAEGELERARTELGRSLEEARATIRSAAEDLARAAAEQVLGRTLS